jgi:hypothetical protein
MQKFISVIILLTYFCIVNKKMAKYKVILPKNMFYKYANKWNQCGRLEAYMDLHYDKTKLQMKNIVAFQCIN